jgi:hypothetical protein
MTGQHCVVAEEFGDIRRLDSGTGQGLEFQPAIIAAQ